MGIFSKKTRCPKRIIETRLTSNRSVQTEPERGKDNLEEGDAAGGEGLEEEGGVGAGEGGLPHEGVGRVARGEARLH